MGDIEQPPYDRRLIFESYIINGMQPVTGPCRKKII